MLIALAFSQMTTCLHYFMGKAPDPMIAVHGLACAVNYVWW